jgi:hypothetical protein
VDIRMRVQSQPDLLQIIRTLGPAAGLTAGMNSRQKEPYQTANDGGDHQQFDERKTAGLSFSRCRPACEKRVHGALL